MQRYFNTEGSCNPREHYMVRLDERLNKIKKLFVDRGKYFVINRGRQYGKTTTLQALAEYLGKSYIVLALDFQKLGTEEFADASIFSKSFARMVIEVFETVQPDDGREVLQSVTALAESPEECSLSELFTGLSIMCAEAERPVVLMIDEVDSASNNQVFVDFLAQLRGYYLAREKTPIFHSVILAGVYDIKNLKLKLRPEGEHKYNSPWNTREVNEENACLHAFDECSWDQMVLTPFDIAAKFNIDMSFPAGQIADMLEEYEADRHSGMDTETVAGEIYAYTSGYPYLVSAICKCIDEELLDAEGADKGEAVWSAAGVAKAVKMILKEDSPLFGSMVKQLETYRELRVMVEDIIYRGRKIPFSPVEKSINLGVMFGFLKEENGHVAIANRIFEMCLLDMFMAEEAGSSAFIRGERDRIRFVKDNRLDMELVLVKFVEYFQEIYGDNDERFVESYGRKFFLLYLKPIINGVGNYYIEAQTRDARRTDVIVDYLGEQFVVELKLWHGNEYNERGERQLADYLDFYHKDKGYMLSFNFNKNKTTGVREVRVGDKMVVEAVV